MSQKSIGITGGIGSGKSIVARVLEIMGFPVFYADAEAKKCMQNDQKLQHSIQDLLGDEAFLNGEIQREFIAKQIFSSPELKEKMNALVHPAVYAAYATWCKNQPNKLVFNESALLFETGSFSRFDATILVTAPEEIRLKRVIQRDQSNAEAVKLRMQNQLPDSEKIPLANFIIHNDDQQLVVPQILVVLEQLEM
jgi:dephospho-CoA kinase